LVDYDKFTREQYDAGEPIDLTLRDFERMKPCNDAQGACYKSCDTGYGTCYTGCGGTVSITHACAPLCFNW
jgi:hypothetical protein